MNQQERDQLTHFLTQLGRAGVPEKVQEADAMIRESLASHPDAAYLLVQRSMLLEQALNTAKAQIAALQKQIQGSRETSRNDFLTGNPWGQSQGPAQIPGAIPGTGNYQVPRALPAANVAASPPSFLGNIASTAAGVVAGSFLFQGIESLLGHHSGGLASDMHADNDDPPEQTVINNYYGSEADPSWNSPDSTDPFLANDDEFLQTDIDESSWI